MKTKGLFIYVHGKGGSAEEAKHYQSLFVESDIIGFDYVRKHPIKWSIPTCILYGGKDSMRPLIEKDIAETEKILTTSNLS